jgi:hypothetical protein
MVDTKLRTIDGDGHVTERQSNILDYLESPWRERATGRTGTTFSLTPSDGIDRNMGGKLFKGAGNTCQAWLEALDLGGLDAAVLYTTSGLFLGMVNDPDHAIAVARGYNNWLSHELCQPSDGKLYGVALLPVQDPGEAAKELRRAVTDLHLSGAMLPADGPNLLGDPKFDVVYQTAAELDCAIAVHASGSLLGQSLNTFPKFIQTHTMSHPISILRQFTSMMFQGVFEKFDRVRFGFMETGGTWVPWWLDRMDEEFEHRGEEEAPVLTQKPSAYVHRGGNIFFGLEAEERLLGPTLDLIGEDLFMYASDWPHWDGDYPESLAEVRRRADLTESQRANVLGGAAQRFYGLT